MTPRNRVIIGDAQQRLGQLADASVDCVITSPPYFNLRNYGVTGQLGLEPQIDDWVEQLRAVTREVWRVLAPHGAMWINVGDSYSRHERFGARPKSLLLGPDRLALALLKDGWIVRNRVVWAKSNPLPSPARDRLTTAHEVVLFCTKQPNYFFDLDAIREPAGAVRRPREAPKLPDGVLGSLAGSRGGLGEMARSGRVAHPLGKNPGDVWRLGSASYRGAHFATFPPELVRRPLLATCPQLVCTACSRPWRRSTRAVSVRSDGQTEPRPLVPCLCQAPTRSGLVLDPFFGTGTVAQVARQFDRDWLGIELQPEYVGLAAARLGLTPGDLASPVDGAAAQRYGAQLRKPAPSLKRGPTGGRRPTGLSTESTHERSAAA